MIYTKKIKTITLKVNEADPQERINTASDVFTLAKAIYANLDDDQEHFTIFFLNAQNKITGFKTLFSGGQAQSNFDMKLIFRNALAFGAIAIICVHNHPSNYLKPSPSDISTTHAIKDAGKLLEINLLDHLIITKTSYYSFNTEGRIF